MALLAVMVMSPMVVMVAAVMMVPRHDHVRHDVVPVMTVVAPMMVMPAVMVVLREHERIGILGGHAAIDRGRARGPRQGLSAASGERPCKSDDGCKHQATHFLVFSVELQNVPRRDGLGSRRGPQSTRVLGTSSRQQRIGLMRIRRMMPRATVRPDQLG